ncbi:MAG: RadC family protein [Fibrobacterota bacterium]
MSPTGHRQRLLGRYLKSGADSLYEYELIELLLTYIIPRQDTKARAKELWERYGSFGRLLAAPPRELRDIPGITERGAALFSLIHDLGEQVLREGIVKRDYITRADDVAQYLRFNYSNLREEFVVVLYLDNQNRVIHPREIARGTVDKCPIYPNRIFNHAFDHKAAALILAHNHPGGSKEISRADREITRRILEAGKLLEVELLDHIIITDSGTVSMRGTPHWPGT